MLLGVDIGYSTTKLIGQYTELKFASIVGTGRERNFTSSKDTDIELEYQGRRYFIGNLAKRESWDATMAFDRNKVNHMNTKLLLLAALGQASKGEVWITTGLPISDYREQRKLLAQALPGCYKIRINGEEKIIIIKDVIVFPQALGALFAISDKIKHNKRTGIIDIGFKTTDFAVLEDGLIYNDRLSRSIDTGISTAYEMTALEQNIDFMEVEFADDKALQAVAIKIQDSIKRVWRDTYFDMVYLCGGGGIALQNYFPDAILLPNAQFKNAEGFYIVSKNKFGGLV